MVKKKRFRFKLILILVIILVPLMALVYSLFIEPSLLVNCHVTINNSKVTSQNDSFKIALFGDTHFGFNYDVSQFHKVVEEINAQEPDLIIFTGDLIDDINSSPVNFSEISGALKGLDAKIGKFAVYGNHDYGSNAHVVYLDVMTAGGFTVLVNSAFELPDYNMVIYGIDDCLIGYGDPHFIADASSETFNLVLCHEPDIFAMLTDYNVSLMLSGHTHGGQVNLPFDTEAFLPPYGKEYVRGLFTQGANTLYVTSGIGTTALPLRFMAVPEIVFINILS